ncbi:MAG: winged helix-turn-helix domain-containing protein [Alphaproteobacteria bacterium]|nr:winged helix-turn-helix domain-containing protein [Alphaproteobacteria bacterium]
MSTVNRLAEIGTLVGDPTRAAMLEALMDGRALTASELARAAGVTPQTASGHLSQLSKAGLLAVEKQGRHRYHRLAGPEVAGLLERLMEWTVGAEPRRARPIATGPRDAAMRRARTCYDHLAGQLGVAISDSLVARNIVTFSDEGGLLSPDGADALREMGITLPATKLKGTRPLCRPCLDWSERRPHIAGVLGATIASHAFEQSWIRRIDGSRAVTVTRAGEAELKRVFGVAGL